MGHYRTGLLGLLLAISGCTGTGDFPFYAEIPQWVTHPSHPSGLAATDCEPRGLNFALDQELAANGARKELGKHLQNRTEAMEKAYQNELAGDGETDRSTLSFDEVAPGVISDHLPKAKIAKTGDVRIQGEDHACVMAAFGGQQLKGILDDLIAASGRQIGEAKRRALLRLLSGSETTQQGRSQAP